MTSGEHKIRLTALLALLLAMSAGHSAWLPIALGWRAHPERSEWCWRA
ncbi:MAG: hypothetical protein HPY76_04085 [Anaerolineae bacterium]|nr:hypothetical protein [Anaerolineae bacterium]